MRNINIKQLPSYYTIIGTLKTSRNSDIHGTLYHLYERALNHKVLKQSD